MSEKMFGLKAPFNRRQFNIKLTNELVSFCFYFLFFAVLQMG